jgi:tRNA(adenine34) deaminase
MQSVPTDEYWMDEALRLAREARDHGEVPVGAVVLVDGQVVGLARNRRNDGNDPMGHAEILALRQAAERIGSWRLDDATMYVTLEPCVMCAGLLVQSRVRRLVFGARDARMGAVRSLYQVCDDLRTHHRLDVVDGVRAHECAALLGSFFAERRKRPARRE